MNKLFILQLHLQQPVESVCFQYIQVETCTYHYTVWQEFFEAELQQSFSFEAKVVVNCDTGIQYWGHCKQLYIHALRYVQILCFTQFPLC